MSILRIFNIEITNVKKKTLIYRYKNNLKKFKKKKIQKTTYKKNVESIDLNIPFNHVNGKPFYVHTKGAKGII